MFVSEQMMRRAAGYYGIPPVIDMRQEVDGEEFQFIRSTQKDSRNHDITMYIFKGDKLIVNAKHHYPSGLFRAPSGGLKPGESLEEGFKREAYEETGAEIEIIKYMLKINITFFSNMGEIPWISHIFKARYKSGELRPVDKREIREVTLAELSEFEKYKKIISGLKSGGLHYRAKLHDEVKKYL